MQHMYVIVPVSLSLARSASGVLIIVLNQELRTLNERLQGMRHRLSLYSKMTARGTSLPEFDSYISLLKDRAIDSNPTVVTQSEPINSSRSQPLPLQQHQERSSTEMVSPSSMSCLSTSSASSTSSDMSVSVSPVFPRAVVSTDSAQ
jgi:hypothetical protein